MVSRRSMHASVPTDLISAPVRRGVEGGWQTCFPQSRVDVLERFVVEVVGRVMLSSIQHRLPEFARAPSEYSAPAMYYWGASIGQPFVTRRSDLRWRDANVS